MMNEYFDIINKDGKNYIMAVFTVNSTNCYVEAEVRKRLRDFDESEYRCGRNTGSMYRLAEHKIDFTVYINVDNDAEYVKKIIDIFEDVNNNIDQIINNH